MVLGNSLSLAIARNSLELIAFGVIFLMLDRPRYTWKKTICIYTVYLTFHTVIGTLWVLSDIESYGKYCTLVIFAWSAVFFPLLSKDKLFQSLYNLSLQIFVLFFQIVFGVTVSLEFFNGNPWADIVVRLLYLAAVIWLYLCFFRKPYRKIVECRSSKWAFTSLVSLCGNLLIIYYATRPALLFYREPRELMIFICIWGLLLITQLSMLQTLFFTQNEMEGKRKIELIEMNNRLLQNQLTFIQKSVQEASRIRHDTRHHDLTIAEFIKKKQYSALLQYLNQYEQEAECSYPIKFCSHTVVDNILAAYARKADQAGIRIDFSISVDSQINIKDTDIVSILANILENAIHGCTESGSASPEISVKIGQKASKLWIQVSNTCLKDLHIKNGLPYSTGSDGVGVLSILHFVEKYGGDTDFTVKDETFICRILLPFSIKPFPIQ